MSRLTPDPPGFRITNGKGIHITFENGHTVSIQFGGGNYCSNYDIEIGSGRDERSIPASGTAEVAAWDRSGKWVKLGDGDDVVGYQTPAEVLAILTRIAALPDESR